MSKQLPYFKFYCDQWLTGDITLEPMELQGTFVNVCAIYWAKECKIEIAKLKQRYGEAIDKLIDLGLVKREEEFAVIKFLDEQWSDFHKTHEKNSANGKKGAEVRWPKHRRAITLIEDKNKEEKIIVGDNKSFYDTAIKDQRWKEQICISQKEKINLQTFEKRMGDFMLRLSIDEEIKPSLKEFKKHFENWLRYQEPFKGGSKLQTTIR